MGDGPESRGCCFRGVQPSWRISKAFRIVAIVLLFLCPDCSKPPLHQPVTLTFLDVEWDAPDQLHGLGQDLQAFTRETGIQVKRLGGPAGSLNQLDLWRELLQEGTTAPDVVGIDAIWSGVLSQYLLDLRPYFESELSSQYPGVLASYTVAGKLVAIPRHAYVGVLHYRSDLLRPFGFREPPKTWDELQMMARRIQAGERAKGEKDFWGYVWQGAADEDLTCNGLEWQVSDGGGRIIEDDQKISVNNPQAIKTWERAASWVGSISPPGVVAYHKWDAENVWASGKAAFLRDWSSDYSLISLHDLPNNATQIGVTSVPGGRTGRAGTLGGNGLAVSRTSAHAHEAIALIRFLLARDVRLQSANGQSAPPQDITLYDLPTILEPYPQAAQVDQNRGGVVSRPSVVTGGRYDEVSRAYIRAVHSVLTGERKPAVAAAALEKELVEITGFKTGPPPKRDWWSR
jgi:trehalose/maltose transport system substrate-binding protein